MRSVRSLCKTIRDTSPLFCEEFLAIHQIAQLSIRVTRRGLHQVMPACRAQGLVGVMKWRDKHLTAHECRTESERPTHSSSEERKSSQHVMRPRRTPDTPPLQRTSASMHDCVVDAQTPNDGLDVRVVHDAFHMFPCCRCAMEERTRIKSKSRNREKGRIYRAIS